MGGRGGRSHAGGGSTGGSTRLMAAKAFLENAYGKKHSQKIIEIINKAPRFIQEMWETYGSKFKAGFIGSYTREAYYSPTEDKVFLGIETVAKGSEVHAPYSTVFHEYGHMTDSLISRSYGHSRGMLHSELYNAGELGETAADELSRHLDRMRKLHPSIQTDYEAARYLIREATGKYNKRDRSDISDMMEGAGIGIGYPLGTGHGLDYWRRVDNGTEIFAEITSAEAANPGSLKAIKEYFPETYAVYQDMIEDWRKHYKK